MKISPYPHILKKVKDKLKHSEGLVRLGGFRDGGYVLPFDSVLQSSVLVSGGVGSNARFEMDCLDINPKLRVVLIDKSFSRYRVLLRLVYHFLQDTKKGFISLVEAASVFKVSGKSLIVRKYLSETFFFSSVLSGIESERILLKLDIEGGEYSQLESILAIESSISAICIEFHGLTDSVNVDALNNFLDSTKLALIFVSVNESSIVDNIPSILELSFVNERFLSNREERTYLHASAFPDKFDCVILQ